MADLISDEQFNPDPVQPTQAPSLLVSDADFKPDPVAPKPDTSPTHNYIKENLKTHYEGQKIKDADEGKAGMSLPGGAPASIGIERDQEGKPKQANDFIDAVEAGLQMSVAGLSLHGKPTTVLPEDAGSFMNIAFLLGEVVPDLPIMGIGSALGGIAGGTVGTAVAPGVGTVAGVTMGAGGGAMALPTAIRSQLMAHYEKGDIKDFQDFWERTSAMLIASTKDFVTGAATMGVGKYVGSALPAALSPLAKTSTQIASEIATMVTVGKGLEGQVPKLEDFTNAALVMGALHSVGPLSGKLREIYAKTGLKPAQIAEHAAAEPTILQDMLSTNNEIPKAYEQFQDPTTIQKSVEVPLDAQVNQPTEGLNQEFSADKIEIQKPEAPEAPKPAPAEEPLQKSEGDLALEKIQEKLGTKAAPETNGEKAIAFAKDQAKNFYTNVIDKFNPINQAVKALSEGKSLPNAADAYKLARIANDAPAKALLFLKYQTFDYKTLEKNGKGLEQILKPVKADIDKFDAYLAARRAVELENRGIKSGFNKEAAQTVVKEFGPQFEEVAKEVTDYNNRTLKYLRDAGFLDKEAYNGLVSAHENYVPLRRLFEDEGKAIGGPNKNAPIKKLKGVKSEAVLTVSPIESMRENTEFFMSLAEKNRAVRSLIDLADKTEGQDLIKKVNNPAIPVKNKSGELLALLKENNIDPSVLDTVGFAKRERNLNDNQFDVWRNGKREVYETTPELAGSIKALDGEPGMTNVVFKIAKGMASTLRMSLSLTPDFIMRNFFRDQLTATALTKYGMNPVDSITAVSELMNKDTSEVYQQFLKSGGASGAFFDLSKDYLDKDIFKLSKETGLMDRAWNVVSTPIHYLKVGSELLEQATRLAEFTKTTAGDYSAEKLIEGGFNAREVTVDFQRMGAKMSAFNAITSFQNAAIQGLDRAGRAAIDNPAGLAKGALLISGISAMTWALNKDDKRVQDLPDWQKNMFWIITTDNWEVANGNDDLSQYPEYLVRQGPNGAEVNRGHIYRFPKPQELGLVFGSGLERVLDAFNGSHPGNGANFAKSLVGALVPAVIPNALTAPIETFANKSLFTGNAIVPAASEGLLPEYRYSDYTSEISKKISSLIATIPAFKHADVIAPPVIDNWITSWSGNLGKYALQTADATGRMIGAFPDTKPDKTLADIPFVQAFIVRHPSSGTRPIIDFYDEYTKYKETLDSITALQKRGDFEKAQKEIDSTDMGKAREFVEAGQAMGNLRRTLHAVNNNPDISGPEKRQHIDGLYYMMNEIAKAKVRKPEVIQ